MGILAKFRKHFFPFLRYTFDLFLSAAEAKLLKVFLLQKVKGHQAEGHFCLRLLSSSLFTVI